MEKEEGRKRKKRRNFVSMRNYGFEQNHPLRKTTFINKQYDIQFIKFILFLIFHFDLLKRIFLKMSFSAIKLVF